MAVKKVRRGVLARSGRLDKGGHKNVVAVVYVSPRTPFVAALKRIDKKLAAPSSAGRRSGSGSSSSELPRVRVVGMGRAIQNVLQLAAGLRARNAPEHERRYGVEVRTLSVTALDEEVDEAAGRAVLRQRVVPAAELLVGLLPN